VDSFLHAASCTTVEYYRCRPAAVEVESPHIVLGVVAGDSTGDPTLALKIAVFVSCISSYFVLCVVIFLSSAAFG